MKTQQVQPKTQPEGHAGNKMGIDVKINSISMEGNILATASINLNQCLAIRNIRLMNGEKGMFLSMPSYRTGYLFSNHSRVPDTDDGSPDVCL